MKIVYSEIIELPIPASYATQTLNFPPQNNLDKTKITGVMAHSLVLGNKSFTGQPLLNATAFKSAYLVLVDNGNRQVAKIALNDIESRPEALRRIQELNPIVINWTKSYIQFGDVTGIATTAESLQLTVYYQ